MEIHSVASDTAESVAPTPTRCSDCVTSSFVVTKSRHPVLLISPRQHVQFLVRSFCRSAHRRPTVSPAGLREAQGLHSDPGVQHGEGQSGRSPHLLLGAHQQEGEHLSAPSGGRGSLADPVEPIGQESGTFSRPSLFWDGGQVDELVQWSKATSRNDWPSGA